MGVCCLSLAYFSRNFSLVLLIKMLLVKKKSVTRKERAAVKFNVLFIPSLI